MSFGSDVIVSVGSADTVNIEPSQANTVVLAPVPPKSDDATEVLSAPAPLLPPSTPCRAWEAAVGKHETSAALERLPAGVNLSAVDEPIRFDATRRQLVYRGFMCHGSYLYLRHLSDDLAYLAALDQLYVQSAQRDSSRRGTAVLTAALAVVAAGLTLALWCLVR